MLGQINENTHTQRGDETYTQKHKDKYTNGVSEPCSAEVADLVLVYSLSLTHTQGLVSLGRKIADPVFTQTHTRIHTHTNTHTSTVSHLS